MLKILSHLRFLLLSSITVSHFATKKPQKLPLKNKNSQINKKALDTRRSAQTKLTKMSLVRSFLLPFSRSRARKSLQGFWHNIFRHYFHIFAYILLL